MNEIESALAELRHMFPGEPVSIHIYDYAGVAGCEGNGYITVHADGQFQGMGATLAEAMQKVRDSLAPPTEAK